jgi:hypothetical protein
MFFHKTAWQMASNIRAGQYCHRRSKAGVRNCFLRARRAIKMLEFGDLGFSRTTGFFAGTMHMPATFCFLAIATEFFGSLELILDFTRNRRVQRRDRYGGCHCDRCITTTGFS